MQQDGQWYNYTLGRYTDVPPDYDSGCLHYIPNILVAKMAYIALLAVGLNPEQAVRETCAIYDRRRSREQFSDFLIRG